MKSLKNAKFRGCLCEQCENVRLKVSALDKRLQKDGCEAYTCKLRDAKNTVNMTLCTKQEGSSFHALACIKRQCKNCGEKILREHLKPVLQLHGAQPISWRKWELVTTTKKEKKVTRRTLVNKHETINNLIQELIEKL